jgi:hypothetical protein
MFFSNIHPKPWQDGYFNTSANLFFANVRCAWAKSMQIVPSFGSRKKNRKSKHGFYPEIFKGGKFKFLDIDLRHLAHSRKMERRRSTPFGAQGVKCKTLSEAQ